MTDFFSQKNFVTSWDARGEVARAVAEWLRWVAGWELGKVRHRNTVCQRCTGSPLVVAAGFGVDVPHQVKHALVMRIQKIVDRQVASEVAARLPGLQAELQHSAEWYAGTGGFDPRAGLAPEFDDGLLDPEPVAGAPFLFTLEELTAVPQPAPQLPMPPLTAAEKEQLRREIAVSDEIASAAGHIACFELQEHRADIAAAIAEFVDPQIAEMFAKLSFNLELPDF